MRGNSLYSNQQFILIFFCQLLIIFLPYQLIMDQNDRKERKIIQLTSQNSLIRGQRQINSSSNSRHRRYFNLASKQKSPRNMMLTSFGKKKLKESKNNNNDYGLDQQNRQRQTQVFQNIHVKNTKTTPKNDLLMNKSKSKFFKTIKQKKHRKYSQKTCSLESIVKIIQSVSPMKRSYMKTTQRSTQAPSPEATFQTRDYKKTIEFLQKQNEYYTDLYMNSQQRVESLKRQTEQQKRKYERVRQIYQQKISQMTQNKQSCQKYIGHIYSYDSPGIDIVPDQVIVQHSIECSTDDILTASRKISQTTNTKMSILSINSR